MKVITIPQADRGLRYVAISDDDAEAVRSDRSMLDHVRARACLDVEEDGTARWGGTGDDTPEGRAAIRDYRAAATQKLHLLIEARSGR